MLATLVIDMQVDFFAHERLAQRRAALVESINELVAISRASGAPVIWVKQEFAADLSDALPEVRRKNIRIVIAGTPGAAILPELDVRPSDIQVIKKRYSAFHGTDLDRLLETLCCDRLIVAGVNSHACVRTTVIDAYQRDYPVLLATDCIASHDADHHAISMRYMDGKLAIGMDNPALFALLGRERH